MIYITFKNWKQKAIDATMENIRLKDHINNLRLGKQAYCDELMRYKALLQKADAEIKDLKWRSYYFCDDLKRWKDPITGRIVSGQDVRTAQLKAELVPHWDTIKATKKKDK